MTTVQKWTGRETRALRHALRMSIRDFAEHLGVSERTVSKWEAGRAAVQPRPETQSALDTALRRASGEAVTRFCAAAGDEFFGPAASAAGDYCIQSHKFIPAHLGAAAAKNLAELPQAKLRPHEWLHVSAVTVPHPAGTHPHEAGGTRGVALRQLRGRPAVGRPAGAGPGGASRGRDDK